jgi:uncharacterized membrane protein
VKTAIGIVLIVFGLGLGLYVGVWWGFVGGIIQIIEQIKAPDISSALVAWGAARVFAPAFLEH